MPLHPPSGHVAMQHAMRAYHAWKHSAAYLFAIWRLLLNLLTTLSDISKFLKNALFFDWLKKTLEEGSQVNLWQQQASLLSLKSMVSCISRTRDFLPKT